MVVKVLKLFYYLKVHFNIIAEKSKKIACVIALFEITSTNYREGFKFNYKIILEYLLKTYKLYFFTHVSSSSTIDFYPYYLPLKYKFLLIPINTFNIYSNMYLSF